MDKTESTSTHFPRWEELPDIDLYMDQLIFFIQKHLKNLFLYDTELTPSMVNNYVKQKLLPAPIKKRYSREHIAALFVICNLKQVLSITEIKEIIDNCAYVTQEESYNSFCSEQEKALQNAESAVQNKNDFLRSDAVLRMAVSASADKAIALRILHTVTK
ncbi:MAG: DUF1836 domain-containing protein [Oscillospiraceae bacterium]